MRQKLFYSFSLLFLTFCLFFLLPPLSALADSRVYNGIDVSEWQGDIDFEAVRKSGVEAVYIRTGEGADYVDAYFESHYQNALAAGLKIGYYHYVTAQNEKEAREQARFFYSLIRGKTTDFRPAMDFESFSGLDKETINEIALAFLETLNDCLGYTPAIYSDTSNAADLWDASLAAYPLWAAEYGVTAPESTGSWDTWAGFQYSDTGNVSGISGQVDLDYFRDTLLIDRSEKPAASACVAYKVRRGDTLWALARRFNTTVPALVQINHIANPDLIYAGQTLIIPR